VNIPVGDLHKYNIDKFGDAWLQISISSEKHKRLWFDIKLMKDNARL